MMGLLKVGDGGRVAGWDRGSRMGGGDVYSWPRKKKKKKKKKWELIWVPLIISIGKKMRTSVGLFILHIWFMFHCLQSYP